MRAARAVPTPWDWKEDHDLADDLLLRPGAGDAVTAFGADAGEIQKAIGIVLDDIEDPLAEGPDQGAGEVGTDALDHA
jgi:hypothetical protein